MATYLFAMDNIEQMYFYRGGPSSYPKPVATSDTYEKFKAACFGNRVATVQAMIDAAEVSSVEAGMAIKRSFEGGAEISDEVKKIISKVYPYAIWDADRLTLYWPMYDVASLKKHLGLGFVFTDQRFDYSNVNNVSDILLYFMIFHQAGKDDDPPEYEGMELVLKLGANPNCKFYAKATLHRFERLSALDVTGIMLNKDHAKACKELLQKYDRTPPGGRINTTDEFYPDSPGYRAKK